MPPGTMLRERRLRVIRDPLAPCDRWRCSPSNFSKALNRRLRPNEPRIVDHLFECRLRRGRRTDAPIRLLVDVEPVEALEERELRLHRRYDILDPFGLVPTDLCRGHLADDDGLVLGREHRVNVLEYLVEGLPAVARGGA